MNGGHKLRILSSENDASVKVQQDQNTNITLKLEQPQLTASQPDLKVPVGAPINIPTPTPTATPPGFIAGAPIPTPAAPQQDPYSSVVYPSAYQVPVASPVQERDIDLTADIADKDAQITVLEALLACYENNPVMINKFVVCKYETLMDIIKVYIYISMCGLMWSNWCEIKIREGIEFSDYSIKQYRYAKQYSKLAQNMIEEK